MAYVSAGDSLASGRGLALFSGETLTVFPPGLPVLIAAGTAAGLGAEWSVRLLNIAAAVALAVLTFMLLRRHVRAMWLVLSGTAFVALSASLLRMTSMAWTEPVFLVVTLAFILILEELLKRPRSVALLVPAVGLVWVAFTFRYAGLSLIAVGVAVLLFGLWRSDRRLAVERAAVFGVASVVVPVGWMLRNWSVDGTLLGPRSPSMDGPTAIAVRTAATIGRWMVPTEQLPTLVAVALGLLAPAAVAGMLLVCRPTRGTSTERAALLPVTMFGFGYCVYIWLASYTTAFDALNSRLLSPVLVPLVVVAMVGVDRLVETRPALRWVAVAGVAGCVIIQSAFFVGVAREYSNGTGYASSEWARSELVGAIAELPDDQVVFSNRPDGVWAVTRRPAVRLSPAKRAYRSTEPDPVPEAFLDAVACNEAVLGWFSGGGRDYLRTPEELEEQVDLEPLAIFDDGVLYRATSRSDSAAVCGN